jgi:hypothetical protein
MWVDLLPIIHYFDTLKVETCCAKFIDRFDKCSAALAISSAIAFCSSVLAVTSSALAEDSCTTPDIN